MSKPFAFFLGFLYILFVLFLLLVNKKHQALIAILFNFLNQEGCFQSYQLFLHHSTMSKNRFFYLHIFFHLHIIYVCHIKTKLKLIILIDYFPRLSVRVISEESLALRAETEFVNFQIRILCNHTAATREIQFPLLGRLEKKCPRCKNKS